jgi:integrase
MWADGGGLYLQCTIGPNDTVRKSWLFRFERNGRERQMGLGSLTTVPVQEAREKAAECRRLLQSGIDPIEQRKLKEAEQQVAASKSMTFDQCRDLFIAAHRAGWRNLKHANQWTNTLKTYVGPIFGNLPVSSVDVTALSLQFVILTATRTGDVLGATWSEIDLKTRVWTLPAARTKAGREHRVPLSSAAMTVLKQTRHFQIDDNEYVFPGDRRATLSNMSLLSLLRRMGRFDLTTHGFRSTFRDWAAERTNFPREVAEMALAHTVGDKVEAAYRRGDLFEKRRRLMEAWAEFCSKSQKPGDQNLLNFRAAT